MTKALLTACAPLFMAGAVAAANNIDDNSVIIDMAGFEGVMLFTVIDDSVANAVATLTVEQAADNNAANMTALPDAVAELISVANDDLNGQILAVDVYQPEKRYLRVNRSSSTANIAFGQVFALRYGARKLPIPEAGIGRLMKVATPLEA